MPPSRIEDYALIGDCETAALVARDGSIDWLCWPRFDSDACFAALLGSREHGRWLMAPAAPVRRVTRRYRPGTLVLETEFETDDGAVVLVDFMPPREEASDLVRIVVGKRGRVAMRTELVARFDYGSVAPWVSRLDDGAFLAVAGPDRLVLRTDVALHDQDRRMQGEFTLAAGQTAAFVLAYSASHLPLPAPLDAQQALARTEAFWTEWSSRCTYSGPWQEPVRQSLVVLKALTYRPTGGIVAAPTTSLPERPGGARNWDYRHCWLRDATFTLLALMDAGYQEEARAWHGWLLRAVAADPSRIQVMYGLAGERHLPESEVPWLLGYEASVPVRVGNDAYRQRQIDIFGEVMDALHQARHGGLVAGEAGWQLERALLDHLEKIWDEPDQGIWEMRSAPQHFTHSKVMAWVAVDRAIKSAEEFGLDGPIDRWRALRQAIHADVCRKAYDPQVGAFVQAYGSRQLDASLLLMALVGFLPPSDGRIVGTVAAIERHLVRDGLVRRYDTQHTADGQESGEGAFLACSFWLADNLVLQGRQVQATQLFERLLDLRNDVGLLAEEYDPVRRRFLGNFPQALSHLSLIGTADNLAMARGPARQRAASDEPQAPDSP